jgi:hypothetical protein
MSVAGVAVCCRAAVDTGQVRGIQQVVGMVNKPFGDPASQLRERHDASDFETKTQDKLEGN